MPKEIGIFKDKVTSLGALLSGSFPLLFHLLHLQQLDLFSFENSQADYKAESFA
jgi:hypothetical protein